MENPEGQRKKFFSLPYRRQCVIEYIYILKKSFLTFVVEDEQVTELQSEILNKPH